MSDQAALECVSCDTSFDPAPSGGFCPDCDTPHPDFEMDADESADEESTGEAASEASDTSGDDAAEAEADKSAAPESISFCPECGTDLAAAHSSEDDESGAACPDCGRAVSDESYCPDCGTDLDAARTEEAEDADSSADEATEEADDEAEPAEDAADDETDAEEPADGDESDEEDASDEEETTDEPESAAVTLVVGDESYGFGDGDTFGRQDEAWLEALVDESGGSDDVAYISSDHLTFSADDDGVYVEDTSRNGTTLNGDDLDDETKLEDGDTLTLAERVELTVEL